MGKTEKQRKNSLFTLSVEMTRKCNMNCSFCARGKAQNMDITKEVIDKMLDEILANDIYINALRLNGGEPTLNPDGIEYLIDSIIKRKLMVRFLCIFTNGTVRNEKIRNALIRFVQYRHSIEKEIAVIAYQAGFMPVNVYRTDNGEGVSLIISDYGHDSTQEEIQKTMDFYKYNDSYFSVMQQKDTFPKGIENYTISGNFVENYKEYLGKRVEVKQIRKINNHYSPVQRYNDSDKPKYYIDKAVTVSANGNVFLGCISSYDRVDADPMFNIMACNGDFMDKFIRWC